jgi:REP element-mobilizing transposase RayT
MAGHDYAAPGYYFVTFCTRRRERCLSQIIEGEVRLLRAGRCVTSMLEGMATRFVGSRVCSAVVMPDHVHLLVEIQTQSDASLHTLLRWIKAGASRLAGRPLWQLGSYDSIVRSARGVKRVIPSSLDMFGPES